MTTPYPCRVDSATIAPRPTGRAKLASDDFPVFHGCSCELGTRNSTFKTKLIFDPMFQLPKSKRSFRSCLVARRSDCAIGTSQIDRIGSAFVEMAILFDDAAVRDFRCPKCGKPVKHTVRWFKKSGHKCPSCNTRIETTNFRRVIRESERLMGKVIGRVRKKSNIRSKH